MSGSVLQHWVLGYPPYGGPANLGSRTVLERSGTCVFSVRSRRVPTNSDRSLRSSILMSDGKPFFLLSVRIARRGSPTVPRKPNSWSLLGVDSHKTESLIPPPRLPPRLLFWARVSRALNRNIQVLMTSGHLTAPAKVEQLMKLCDALEACLRRSEGRAAKLV
jgi:hypothetical protein